MDYAKMIKYHKQTEADCTIAVIDVPIEEASRFGIMSTNPDNSIYKFSEKPKNPDSTKASMGIYVFNKDKLIKYLRDDAADPDSSNDFGKNIIPNMLAAGEKMFAYSFEGYWKDVGTISSLWEANMDMLGANPQINLNDESWRIFSRHSNESPQYIGAEATVVNSSITEGCEVYGEVINSVLGAGVKVGKGAVVRDAVIMGGVNVGENARIEYSIIDSNVNVGAGASVGKPKAEAKGITVVGMGLNIPDGKTIGDDEMVTNI